MRARFGAGSVPLYLTEFGYQTHPPDPLGVSPAQQARYLNQAEYLAYRNEVEQAAARVNDRWSTGDWEPVILDQRDNYARSLAGFRRSPVVTTYAMTGRGWVGVRPRPRNWPAALRPRS